MKNAIRLYAFDNAKQEILKTKCYEKYYDLKNCFHFFVVGENSAYLHADGDFPQCCVGLSLFLC